jgi:hypothetical protein
MQKGDYITKNGERRKVLEVVGYIVFVSMPKGVSPEWETMTSFLETRQKLEREGWKVEGKKWVPALDERYYFVGSDGSVVSLHYINTQIEIDRVKIGNCFPDEASASRAAERVKKALKEE